MGQAPAGEFGDEREQREGESGEQPLMPPRTLHDVSVPDRARLVQTGSK
jgi:hypothetical protein